MSIFKPDIAALIKADNKEKLIRLLGHRSALVRQEVFVYALTQKDDPLMYKAMLEMSTDPDFNLRNFFIEKLAKAGERGVLAGLFPVIRKGDQAQKMYALRTLADYANKDDLAVIQAVVQALLDKKPLVRVEAIRTLGALNNQSAYVHVINCLHDPHSPIRLEAARTLGKIAVNETIIALVGALLDEHHEVRAAVRESLAGIDNDLARKALHNAPFQLLLKRMSADTGSREDAILYIAKEKLMDGVPLLYHACRDRYKNIRLQAVKALREFQDEKGLDVLRLLINDHYYDVRIETIKTLEKIHTPGSLSIIDKARADKNSNVRKEAERAYYEVKGRL